MRPVDADALVDEREQFYDLRGEVAFAVRVEDIAAAPTVRGEPMADGPKVREYEQHRADAERDACPFCVDADLADAAIAELQAENERLRWERDDLIEELVLTTKATEEGIKRDLAARWRVRLAAHLKGRM